MKNSDPKTARSSPIQHLAISLAFGASILFAYGAWLDRSGRTPAKYQNQWIANYGLLERYVHGGTRRDLVVVGSSMAAKLDVTFLHPNALNLSFAGSGPVTGLKVINNRERPPAVILVETNLLEKPSDIALVTYSERGFMSALREWIPFLRYQHQPANFLYSWIHRKFGRSEDERLGEVPDEDLFSVEIGRKIAFENEVTVTLERDDLAEVTEQIEIAARSGARIVLFQMPVDVRLLQSDGYRHRDRLVEEMFPTLTYLKSTRSDSLKYPTADGNHLLDASAARFAEELALRVRETLDAR